MCLPLTKPWGDSSLGAFETLGFVGAFTATARGVGCDFWAIGARRGGASAAVLTAVLGAALGGFLEAMVKTEFCGDGLRLTRMRCGNNNFQKDNIVCISYRVLRLRMRAR